MRAVPGAEREELTTVRREDDDLVGVAISQEEAIRPVDVGAVRIEDAAAAIGTGKRAVRREYHHRRIAALDGVDAAASVDGDLADHRRRDIGRQPAPVAFHGVGVAGKPDNPGGGHDRGLAVAAALGESAAADRGRIENIEPQPVIRAGSASAR